jgi:hypothetical protein
MTPQELEELGYEMPRQLPDGRWIAGQQMLFTYRLFVGIDRIGWRTAFCYPNKIEALGALLEWDGIDYPPGMWIKQKPEGTLNPRWANASSQDIPDTD